MPAVWRIYHVENCSHTRPAPKDKFVAIVCRDLKLMGFLINSNVNRYIQKHPDLLACQAIIEASNHSCLGHDSYVDCVDLYSFEDAELADGRDPISKQARAKIEKAVANSKTIETRYKKLILGNR